MKYYTLDIITLKITCVAESSEELIDRINYDTVDMENNWIASERELDEVIKTKYAYYRTDTRRLANLMP